MSSILTELPTGAMTLRPVDQATEELAELFGLPRWASETDGRYVVRPVTIIDGTVVYNRLRLDRGWTTTATWDGRIIQVRAADCGADCYCAAEFRFVL